MTIPESQEVRCSSLFRNCQKRESRGFTGFAEHAPQGEMLRLTHFVSYGIMEADGR